MIGQPVTASNSHPNGCNLERRRKRSRDSLVVDIDVGLEYLAEAPIRLLACSMDLNMRNFQT